MKPDDSTKDEPARPVGFTCPRCQRTSYHPTDVAEGYCGACHDWTGADLTDQPLSK